MATRDDALGFAPQHDVPVRYIERVRDYYRALGYGAPYEWAHYAEVPFRRLAAPLAACRVALVTTAAPYQPGKGDQGPGAPYNARVKFYAVYSGDASVDPELTIAHLAIDRVHTTAEDPGSYFPLRALRAAAAAGRIGAVAARFHGMPTNRSQRATLDADCPEVVARCREDGVDAAILVANCPVCHQSVALAARSLEQNGIATVVMGCAKDIVEFVGVPRFLFSDFPLGNAAGRPNDRASQATTLELALRVLEAAPAPRTTVQSPQRWSPSADWKRDYCDVERLTPEEIARRRAAFDRAKDEARAARCTGTLAARHDPRSMTEASRTVKCPQCGKPVEWSPASRWRPFCSERCKTIDLGAWASEAYRVPTVDAPDDGTMSDNAPQTPRPPDTP